MLSRSAQRILSGVVAFFGICLVGSLGYMAAGWSLPDSIYMVIITIFGVGYGEVRPVQTPALRSFTAGVIVAGYAAAVYVVGVLVQMVTEGEIHRALGARRMAAGIENLENHAIICGFGRIGRILAQQLSSAGWSLVVLDCSEEKVREASEAGLLAMVGDGTQEDVLKRAGVDSARVLATVLPQDALNVFVTLTASGLAPNLKILARAEDPASEAKLRRSGASEVVLPAASGAERLAHLITQPEVAAMLETVDQRGELNHELDRVGLTLQELSVPASSPLVGARVGDIEIGGNHGFLIVAVRHEDGKVIVNPPDTTPLAEKHTLIVLGHANDMPLLKARYELRRQHTYRGVRYES